MLGQIDEVGGEEAPAVGVVPPAQRFEPLDATRADGEDRLVVEYELAPFEPVEELTG